MSDSTPEPTAIFIDENIGIYEGEQARLRLQSKANIESIDAGRGVTQVDPARWQEAQRYERRTWLQKGRWALTDRNEHHQERFANYAPLHGLKFRRGIELGCGPFTNMQLILEHCNIEQIYLLDPLIEDYLTHPFCRYRRCRLGGVLNENLWRLPSYARWPLQCVRSKINDYRIGGLMGRPITIEPSMIETYHTDQRFDLVVMINVLEHCQDATAVLNKIDEILGPEGILVFHDKLYEVEDIKRLSKVLYDAGHPLRVDQSVIQRYLHQNTSLLMQAQYRVQSEFRGLSLRYYDLYYIGQKRQKITA